jgi:hypothetical protein
VKFFTPNSEFLGFYVYLCHVIDDFLVLFCNTKISEKSDKAKSWATFYCPITYKEKLTKVMWNLGN